MSEQSGSWQPDPFGRNEYRYWDGTQWTDQVSNAGEVATDPAVAGASAADTGATGPDHTPDTPSEPSPTAPQEPAAPESAGWGATDPTTSMAGTPPPPGPSDPGPPTGPPPDQPGGSGSNLPGILVGVVLLAAIIGALVWFLVLAGDDDDEDLRSEVIASFRSEEGLTAADANCVADELDEAGLLNDIGRAIRDGDQPTNAQRVAVLDAYEACGIDDDEPAPPDDTTTTTEDDNGGASGPGDVSIPVPMMRLMVEEMVAESGLSYEQAECFLTGMLGGLTDEQFEALLSDPDSFDEMDFLTDADALMMFFTLFDECDINPFELDDFGGGGFDDGFGGILPGDTYGDNPTLDALWDACDAGDDEACDDLFRRSESGSEYEEFGDTCAGRGRDGIWCVD